MSGLHPGNHAILRTISEQVWDRILCRQTASPCFREPLRSTRVPRFDNVLARCVGLQAQLGQFLAGFWGCVGRLILLVRTNALCAGLCHAIAAKSDCET